MLKLKRAYDERAEDDGTRVLVDRVWPRGVTKERAAIDWWAKGLAPSEELRKWFSHDPKRFDEFAERYEAELAGSPGGRGADGRAGELPQAVGAPLRLPDPGAFGERLPLLQRRGPGRHSPHARPRGP